MKRIACVLLIALIAFASVGAYAEAKPFEGTTLTVFNCYDYINEDVIDLFEEETGAKIEYVNYTTNEEMYTKLEAGAAMYDIIFPSDYMIERLIAEDRLETLDLANIPNREGVAEWLKNTDYDPEGAYSVPYMWGTYGILYNTDMVSGPIDSWGVLFSEEYANSVFMMDSQRDTIGIGLKYLGYSLNTRDADEMQAATDLLVEQKATVHPGYMLDEIKDKMVGNEAALGIVYSGDALYAMEKNEALDYVVPMEGGNIWVDGMCIPKGSQNKACAEAFIDFMCREDIAEMNLDYIYYSSPIQSVADSYTADLDEKSAAVMNPAQEVIDRCEFFHDTTDAMDLYEEAWMQIRLAR